MLMKLKLSLFGIACAAFSVAACFGFRCPAPGCPACKVVGK